VLNDLATFPPAQLVAQKKYKKAAKVLNIFVEYWGFPNPKFSKIQLFYSKNI